MRRKQENKLKGSREKKEERGGKLGRRKKNPKLPLHLLVSFLAALKMLMMMSPIKCIARRTRKERTRRTTTKKYATVSFNYSSMSMTNHDQKPFINVSIGKLPHFKGTNFAKWKHLMRAYLIFLHLGIWEVLWLQRQHYAQACRSETKIPKGNIEEPLCLSWYLVSPSTLRGDRDWYLDGKYKQLEERYSILWG